MDPRGSSPDYVHTLTVRYSECDVQGVVFNAHYQSLCDAVMDLWVRDRMGVEWQRTKGCDFSMVRSSKFEYNSPARFLDDLQIAGKIVNWGRTSFEIAWNGTITDENGSPQTVFHGWMTHVCVEKGLNGEYFPAEIDETFREKIVKRQTLKARL